MGKVNAEYDLIPSSRALGAGILFVSNERPTGFCRMISFSVVMVVMDVLYQECQLVGDLFLQFLDLQCYMVEATLYPG